MNLDVFDGELRNKKFEEEMRNLSLKSIDDEVWEKLKEKFTFLENEESYLYMSDRSLVEMDYDTEAVFCGLTIIKVKSEQVVFVEYNKYLFSGGSQNSEFINEGDTFVERMETWKNGELIEKFGNVIQDFNGKFKGKVPALEIFNRELRDKEFEKEIKILVENYNNEKVWSDLKEKLDFTETDVYTEYRVGLEPVAIDSKRKVYISDIAITRFKKMELIQVEYNRYLFTGDTKPSKFINEGDTFVEKMEIWKDGVLTEVSNNLIYDEDMVIIWGDVDKRTIIGSILLGISEE